MIEKVTVTVSSIRKNNFFKVKQVQSLLQTHGMGFICENVLLLYKLEGKMNKQEIIKIAEELLTDRIVEKYSVDQRPDNHNIFFADIWYKQGVTDVVGESVLKAIRDLDIFSVQNVLSGIRYKIVKKNRKSEGTIEKKILDFVNKELLNPLIQQCQLQKL